jgi:hypothetical protein
MQQISLSIKDFVEKSSAEPNWGKRDTESLPSSGLGHNEFASLSQNVDHALLLVLQVCSCSAISCG